MMQAYHPKLGNTLLIKRYTKADLAEHDIPSLGLVRATYGADVTKEWICNHLFDLIDYNEAQQGVENEKIEELATLILASYYYLNLADIMLFCAEVKLGKYGKFYGVTGPSQLAAMLQEYVKYRQNEIIAVERRKNSEHAIALHNEENGYKAYLSSLQSKAEQGDEEAKATLLRHKIKI